MADTAVPARAAVEWFVPMLGGDPVFERLVADALREMKGRKLAQRAAETRDELRYMRGALADAGLSDVMIGIPYVESKMRPDVTSPQCAGGYWQFLPEIAVNEGLRVSSCALEEPADGDGLPDVYSPGRRLPSRSNRVYLGPSGCRIDACAVDERRDFRRSTDAAARHLARLSDDPVLAGHPHRVPLTILAFNTGIGGAERLVRVTDGDPFAVVPACATGDCLVLGKESARYVPRVVAAAAVVACNGADAGDSALSDWARSDLCGALHEAGLGPPQITDRDALAKAASRRDGGLKIALAAFAADDAGLDLERHQLDVVLAHALSEIEGVSLLLGVPGELPDQLLEQGADVVLTGRIGRRGDRVWVRLESWNAGRADPASAAFSLIDPENLDLDDIVSLAADALLRPVRDRQADAIGAMVASHRGALSECLPAVMAGQDEPLASVSLRLDNTGRATAMLVRPEVIDEPVLACIEEHLAQIRFPRELAGAGATLELGVEAPAVVELGEQE